MKGVSVPTFAAQTVHGPTGSTMQATKTVTGCVYVIMEIKSGTKTQTLTIHTKEGKASRIDRAENIITIITVEQTRGVTECVKNIVEEALRIRVMEGDATEDIFS